MKVMKIIEKDKKERKKWLKAWKKFSEFLRFYKSNRRKIRKALKTLEKLKDLRDLTKNLIFERTLDEELRLVLTNLIDKVYYPVIKIGRKELLAYLDKKRLEYATNLRNRSVGFELVGKRVVAKFWDNPNTPKISFEIKKDLSGKRLKYVLEVFLNGVLA